MSKKDLLLINENTIKNKIYIIRNQKVMLDIDLAYIYGYTTKRFNEQVKNNIKKFEGSDFMFQLTNEETNTILRSKNSTSRWGGSRYKHFVFTEQGIYMLMTVLRGPLAIKQSRALIMLFKSMKDYLVENRNLFSLKELELRTIVLEKDVKDIKDDNKVIKTELTKVVDNFIDPSTYKEFLILDGKKLEADIAYKKIIKLAKYSIIYIDDYVNLKTLEIFSSIINNVDITLVTDNKAKDKITSYMVDDFNEQYPTNKLKIIKNGKSHDRFIIIDFNTKNEKIYHCGASLKDAGNKITTILKIDDTSIYHKKINELLKHKVLSI